jgi:glutamate synthase domain-containing protein 1/glutamate synthase domain-containing protein 3
LNDSKLVSKDDCGVFAILKKKHAKKISNQVAVDGIECVRFRGSKFGAGFASFNLENSNQEFLLSIFVENENTFDEIKDILNGYNFSIHDIKSKKITASELSLDMSLIVKTSDSVKLSNVVNQINYKFSIPNYRARIYSSGNYVNVYKDIGYPSDVARSTGLIDSNSSADLWIAHTRQPTNSPGSSAIWCHPFSNSNTAIVHNGDISSFGSNMNFLQYRGVTNLVGTDSEVIAFIVDYLARIENLSMEDIGLILSNPYDRFLYRLGDEKTNYIRNLLYHYRGAELDGPFTIFIGYSDGDDVYLLAVIDRSKFRPVVIGEDEDNIYMASEECQIRMLSPKANIWTPQPGRFVFASMNKGIIESGRDSNIIDSVKSSDLIEIDSSHNSSANIIDSNKLSSYELNTHIKSILSSGPKSINLMNVSGQRYLGVNLPKNSELNIYGTPGNCLANFNKGTNINVYGSAEDNVADTMYEGKIKIHGNTRDVIGYALQGGQIFVRGNVGNRAFILMREYEESRPVVIVGNRADDYFCEYMSGGLALVLGIDSLDSSKSEQLVGNFLATGMLRGLIYVRGKVDSDSIGLNPPREDIINYLSYMNYKGIIDDQLFEKLSIASDINLNILKLELSEQAFESINKLFSSKYSVNLDIEYRKLDDSDLELLNPYLKEFTSDFNISNDILNKLVNSDYTIIKSIDKFNDSKVPKVTVVEE